MEILKANEIGQKIYLLLNKKIMKEEWVKDIKPHITKVYIYENIKTLGDELSFDELLLKN